MKQGKIIVLSGPSASGKTTLYKRLLKKDLNLVRGVSMTTRPKRVGERHGCDYFFISRKMFFYKRGANHFLESEKVFDNYYGTPRKQTGDLLKAGKNVLLCIDVKGAENIRRRFSEAVCIFVKTATISELRRRLEQRGSEDKATVAMRLTAARQELREAMHYDYVIVNNKLDVALKKLESIIRKEIF